MYTGLSCLSFAWMTVKSVLYLFELAKLSNEQRECDYADLVLYLFELAKLSNASDRFYRAMQVLYLFELAKLSNCDELAETSPTFCIFLN